MTTSPKKVVERTSWGGIHVVDHTYIEPKEPKPPKVKNIKHKPKIIVAQSVPKKTAKRRSYKHSKKISSKLDPVVVEQRRRQRLEAQRIIKNILRISNEEQIEIRTTIQQNIRDRILKQPLPSKKRSDTDTEAQERAALARANKLKSIRREETLKYWSTRDTNKVAQLKAMWAQRDAANARLLQNRLHDYICMLCNRPFSTVRRFYRIHPVRCPSCKRFVRLKAQRDRYLQQRLDRLAYAAMQRAQGIDTDFIRRTEKKKARAKLSKPTHPVGYVTPPITPPYQAEPGGPVVVWSPK